MLKYLEFPEFLDIKVVINMKLQGYVQKVDKNRNSVLIKLPNTKAIDRINEMSVVDIVTDADQKHQYRKLIFSLIGFLWNKKNFEIFGALKNEMRAAVEKTIFIKGEQYAREFYRFNIHLECNFTNKTIGVFPTEDGQYIRMIGEVAKSLSNESGITTDELKTFYQELEHLVVLHNGHEFLEEWIKRRDI